jgi:hypothetical protein
MTDMDKTLSIGIITITIVLVPKIKDLISLDT